MTTGAGGPGEGRSDVGRRSRRCRGRIRRQRWGRHGCGRRGRGEDVGHPRRSLVDALAGDHGRRPEERHPGVVGEHGALDHGALAVRVGAKEVGGGSAREEGVEGVLATGVAPLAAVGIELVGDELGRCPCRRGGDSAGDDCPAGDEGGPAEQVLAGEECGHGCVGALAGLFLRTGEPGGGGAPAVRDSGSTALRRHRPEGSARSRTHHPAAARSPEPNGGPHRAASSAAGTACVFEVPHRHEGYSP